ncbi:hypothetical protein U1Q18_041641 [Sarracenia purpurea var. burkii]
MAATSCCCCYYSTYCTTPSPDPLLHSAASYIHPSPPRPHLYSPPYEAFQHQHHHQTLHHPLPTHHPKQQEFQAHLYNHNRTQPVVSSLLRRIAALESSLHHHYDPNLAPSHSLRHAAARTIQTHFRAFLVRRSRTLRQLKDLASIKSTLNTLKKISSFDNAHLDSQDLYFRATDLLLKLNFIQGGDPMIRDGRRSISREIIRFIEFIDGVSLKKNEISRIESKNVRFGSRTGNKSRVSYGNERILMGKLRSQVENKTHGSSVVSEDDDDGEARVELENPKISINDKFGSSRTRNGGLKAPGEVQARVKRSVRFADNRNVYRVFSSTHEPVSIGDTNGSDGSGSIDDERELVDNFCGEVDKIRIFSEGNEDDEESQTEDGGSPCISNGERNPRRSLRGEDNFEISGHYQGEDGDFVFSAPLPVKMESRADLVKRMERMAVKMVN